MPPPLRIPPRYLPGLRALAALPAENARELEVALGEVPPRLTTESLARQARQAVPTADDVAVMLEALLSLAALFPRTTPRASVR
jgi:hypothetical protein